MFVSVLLSWFVLLPADMKAFSQSPSKYNALASPNLFFWLQTDYFSPAAEMNPLHMEFGGWKSSFISLASDYSSYLAVRA